MAEQTKTSSCYFAGVALRDSPVGLASYILEKFAVWTNKTNKFLPDGGIEKKFTLTDLLDNVMIYWVTDSITTSMRLYAESFNSAQFSLGMDKYVYIIPSQYFLLNDERIECQLW